MNLILLAEHERTLPRRDPRARHITGILKLKTGDTFSAGIIGGCTGTARLISADDGGLALEFHPEKAPLPLYPLTLILGCPRPPVARRLLRDMTAAGIGEIRICSTDLNEKSYLSSSLWSKSEWKNELIKGAGQGGSTLLPKVSVFSGLKRALEGLPAGAQIAALDNESHQNQPFKKFCAEAVLAVGPERGWSDRERSIFDSLGIPRLRIGNRILRTETACSAGVTLMLGAMGAYPSFL